MRQPPKSDRPGSTRAQREASPADRIQAEFLANMSHELRTPLNSIIGFSELLIHEAGSSLEPRQRQYLEEVHASGKQLLGVINDVLDLSKLEANAVHLACEAVTADRALEDVVQLLEPQAEEKSLGFEMRASSGRRVAADPARLQQILCNLISNAIKFSPAGARIELAAADEGDRVTFSVGDHGPGIEEGLRARLYQPFVQGEPALTKRHHGAGLGLAICKRLVELHGGRLELESPPPGQATGARFWFSLPAVDGASAGTNLHRSATVARTEVPRVLVIDDDPAVGAMLTGLLERAGYLVRASALGESGLTLARSEPPDAVVVDLGLPDISGFLLVEDLASHNQTRQCPIIILTGRDLSLDESRRLRPHVRGVIRKGDVVGTDLLALLDGALKPREAGGGAPTPQIVVLVVDDHDLNRELVRSVLERRGQTVLQARNGEEGVRMARQHHPDVVLMDMAMPRKDGLAATLELRADPDTRQIPIVALTALAQRDDEERARAAGVDDYLTKPIDRRRLEETVDRLAAQRGVAP